jgi:hypothetical protein
LRSPWSEDDVETLKELHAEFKTYSVDEMIDFIIQDPRLDRKTKKSIREKLVELGFIRGTVSKVFFRHTQTHVFAKDINEFFCRRLVGWVAVWNRR